jgi:hypothetical protein
MDPVYRNSKRRPQKPQISQLYKTKSGTDQEEACRDDQLLSSTDLWAPQESPHQ